MNNRLKGRLALLALLTVGFISTGFIGDNRGLHGKKVIIGDNATSGGEDTVNLGSDTATGSDSVAVGKSARASGARSVAIGVGAKASVGIAHVVIGSDAEVHTPNYSGIAIGNQAYSGGQGDNISIGGGIWNGTGGFSTCVGTWTYNNGWNNVAIGIGAETKNGADDSVAIGRIAKCTKNTYGQIAIGSGAEAYGFESVQIGYGRNTANTSIQFHDWQLINSQGKIPNERMTGVTQNVTLADGTVLVIQNGLITSIQ